MEGFNKAISFILGLVVVVVFIAIVTGRINLFKKGGQPIFSGGIFSSATPTPSLEPAPTSSAMILSPTAGQANPTNHPYQSNNSGAVKTPSTIPSTGPEMLIPLVAFALVLGVFLRRLALK